MGGKVIKFNLMGAIAIVIIIVAVIAGIVVFAIRGRHTADNKNEEEKKEAVLEDEDSYDELDRKDAVIVNGVYKEITLRTYEKNAQYSIEYDIDSFFVNDTNPTKTYFESLVSDSISIEIQKNAEFRNKSEELISHENERQKENNTYRLETRDFNGRVCYIETKEEDKDVMKNYYIENGNEYYLIKVVCGKDYKETTMPIIEKMIGTFKFM